MKVSKNILRIVTITLFLLICYSDHVNAFDLDMTVEDDIRKNYNSSKLVKDTNIEELEPLPDLPNHLKSKSTVEVKTDTAKYTPPKQIASFGNVKMTKGTSFNVVNMTKISDWQRRGTVLKFKTTALINKRGYTLPAGTVFIGEVTESHQPQISCNGGLVVIKITSMVYKGQSVPLNAYITRANDKIIFLNNIKGERTYLKTVWKKGNWGRSLFSRMMTLTVNLGGDGSTFLLSPFPLLYGSLCFGANTIISPLTAFFEKGKHISIEAGKHFRIKLIDDSFID